MAKSQHSKIGKSYTAFSGKVTTAGVRMASQDIRAWVDAINAARNPTNPKRKKLYTLFDNIIIDGHLESVIEKRALAITNKRVEYYQDGEANMDEIKNEILEAPWFREFQMLLAQAIPYGHSLVELIPEKGLIRDVELIPRFNVVQEKGLIFTDAAQNGDGFNYRDPNFQYYNYTIEAGSKRDYGKLMTAAQYVIYKRGGFGDWAQFAEIFGSPFRVGKYNKYDSAARDSLEDKLENMGSAPYAVIPEGASIEFHDNNNAGKSEVFADLIKICNEELSKIFLGQTMTTVDGSSKSQSETHKEVEEEINLSDIIQMEFILNWKLKPKLIAIGYPLAEDGKFSYDLTKALPIEKRIEIDLKLSEKIDYPEEYWYKTYGIPKPKPGEKVTSPKQSAPIVDPKKKKDSQNLIPGLFNIANISEENEDFLNDFYHNHHLYSPEFLTDNIDQLKEAVSQEFDISSDFMSPDYQASMMMELNVNRFGWNKTLAQVYELNKALKSSGSYSAFRREAVDILGKFDSFLQTEYDTAISLSQNAASYIRQLKDKDLFPYWRFETMGDQKVRASHDALDGTIFKLDDKAAGKFTPPLDFGCRCYRTAIRKDQVDKKEVKTAAYAIKALGSDYDKMKDNGFAFNPGDTLSVFDLNKAYISQLPRSARKNSETASYAEYGLKSIAAIRKAKKLAALKAKNMTAAQALEEFNKKSTSVTINNKSVEALLITDHNNRKIALTKNTLTKISKTDAINYFDAVKDVLKNADEIYLNKTRNVNQYTYIKYYKDDVIVVKVSIDKNTGMQITDWFKNTKDEAQLRKGILIKRV